MLHLLLCHLLAMIIVSGLLSEWTLKGLKATRRLPSQVFAATPFLVSIDLRNEKRWMPSFSVQVEDGIEQSHIAKRCYFLKIPPKTNQETNYRFEIPKRGLYKYKYIKIGTRFPFSFFLKTYRFSQGSDLIVFPRLIDLSDLFFEKLINKNKIKENDPFLIRKYRENDSLHLINWKISAKKNELYVVDHITEDKKILSVFLNTKIKDLNENQEDVEYLISLASSVVIKLLKQHKIKLIMNQETIHLDEGHEDDFLKFMSFLSFSEEIEDSFIKPANVDILIAHSSSNLWSYIQSMYLIDENLRIN
ncbi:DUF58 domain-containing protein [Myxococcota bacterium]|nr:DUF58 domain-containing protein [Myxococcota bacterium]